MSSIENITQLFYTSASTYPDAIAIIHKGKEITYQDLVKEVNSTADYFASQGIQKGDRVLIFVPMSIDLYRIVLALFSMGATAVFLDEWVSKSRMELCCQIADCKGFIGIPKAQILRLFSKELRAIPIHLKRSKRGNPNANYPLQMDENDTALITFTTGSTGTPKAANRTHSFLHAQFIALEDKLKAQPGDVDLPALPIVLLINLGLGVTSVIYNYKPSKPATIRPDKLVKTIQRYQIQRIISSPDFLIRFSSHLLDNKIDLSSITSLFTGGAPVFPEQATLLTNAFPNTSIEIVYGSTEAEPISGVDAALLSKTDMNNLKGLPVGTISDFAEVKIIEIRDEIIQCDDENELPVVDGIGEIIVAGNHVLTSYFNNEKALKRNKIFLPNKVFHRTGDSGFIKDGQLYLTGRCATIIDYQGTKIYPFIVEQQLKAIPEIEMGTIMLVDDQPHLIIETKEDQAIISELVSKKLHFDYPILWKNLPRDPRHHSKIDYEILKKQVS